MNIQILFLSKMSLLFYFFILKLIGKSRVEFRVKIKSPYGKENLIFINNFDFVVYIALC